VGACGRPSAGGGEREREGEVRRAGHGSASAGARRAPPMIAAARGWRQPRGGGRPLGGRGGCGGCSHG
jgi:hypothetical protein